ncbi:MAG: cytochrome b N-terminal domain-containing protein [Planctomycetota bacterium]|jgi:quinol-cytochrome oxidoreductase complex cytochrome b subunit
MPEQPGFFRQIFDSIFPPALRMPKKEAGYRSFFNTLILHLRPRTVPERTLRFNLTWGLGGMALVLVALLISTGVLLKFMYRPFPGEAYTSILELQQEVLFGSMVRSIHHWSGHILLVIAFLHLLRVFFTGAFHGPRQFNWIIGLALFALLLLSNFTGYLLPWDQLSFWAITICTGMLEYIPLVGAQAQEIIRGGSEVGPNTLSNFYAMHTALLPILLFIIMPFHFWRVRKARGLVVPRTPEEDSKNLGASVPAIPNLILREIVTALVLIAFILIIAALFDAPLGAKANPGLSPNPTKAPWYFMGFQEMLLHFHPLFALFIMPVILLVALLGLPYLRYESDSSGVWFVSRKGRSLALLAACAALVVTTLWIVADEYVVNLAGWMPGVPTFLSNGLIPFLILLALLIGFYRWIRKGFTASNNEAIQSVFVLLLVAFIILTFTGVWFRGQGMELIWPWMTVSGS